MNIDLTDKAAIITGASSGMGAATARLMARAGARVAITGRNRDRLDAVRDEIAAGGGEAVVIPADLAEVAAAGQIVDAAVDGLGAIDYLIHSAGLYGPAPIEDATLESFELQWAVNVRAPFLLTQLALPHTRDGGAIVFISSTVARAGFPGCAAYTATKGAIESMARALAAELAPRIRVNVIAPGFVLTPMVTSQIDANPDMEGWLVDSTPLGFVGQAEDIAGGVAFLCSDASAYTHGTTLVIDGGWSARARG
jgi:NAD(P)-dependent dehydrogenase (short-subunit alcohol dehydrogenase family)